MVLYFKAFYKHCSRIIFEKRVVSPQFSFSISVTLVKIYISRIIINRGKIPLN